VSSVTWYEAAEYCNWLSAREGIPEDQWCYRPSPGGKYAEGMKLAPGWRGRTGYRLPTEAEHEHACRAGCATDWSCGRAVDLLEKYDWYDRNSFGRMYAGGILKPNDAGLFDMMGNAEEWCQDRPWQPVKDKEDITDKYARVLRGGSFDLLASYVRCAYRLEHVPADRLEFAGLRPARTVRLVP
jgi:formylglycine-generating enzyme required for sulfatase activity